MVIFKTTKILKIFLKDYFFCPDLSDKLELIKKFNTYAKVNFLHSFVIPLYDDGRLEPKMLMWGSGSILFL